MRWENNKRMERTGKETQSEAGTGTAAGLVHAERARQRACPKHRFRKVFLRKPFRLASLGEELKLLPRKV